MGSINRYLIVALLLACLAVVVLYVKGLNYELSLMAQRLEVQTAMNDTQARVIERLDEEVGTLSAAYEELKGTLGTQDKMVSELELILNNK